MLLLLYGAACSAPTSTVAVYGWGPVDDPGATGAIYCGGGGGGGFVDDGGEAVDESAMMDFL